MNLRHLLKLNLFKMATIFLFAILAILSATQWTMIQRNRKLAETVILNYVGSIGAQHILTRDYMSLQRNVDGFIKAFDSGSGIRSRVEVFVDNRPLASFDDLIGHEIFSRTSIVSRSLPNDEELKVVLTVSYSHLVAKAILLLAAILLGVGATFTVLYRLGLRLLNVTLEPLEGVTKLIVQKSENLRMEHLSWDTFDDGKVKEVSQLKGALELLLSEIRRLHKEEQQASFLKGQIRTARQISHDLKSPLSALNIALTRSNAADQGNWDLIKLAAKRINNIADEVLNKCRDVHLLKSQNTGKPISTTEFNRLVEEVVKLKALEHPALKISAQLPQENIPNTGFGFDSTSLSRILSNLINNSAEANAENIRISATQNENGFFKVVVSDDGRGIPSEVTKLLFTQNVSTKAQGSGIGLRDAFNRVTAINGKMRVDSSSGGGCLIEMLFPLYN
jgi:signal transduction histidine kinase